MPPAGRGPTPHTRLNSAPNDTSICVMRSATPPYQQRYQTSQQHGTQPGWTQQVRLRAAKAFNFKYHRQRWPRSSRGDGWLYASTLLRYASAMLFSTDFRIDDKNSPPPSPRKSPTVILYLLGHSKGITTAPNSTQLVKLKIIRISQLNSTLRSSLLSVELSWALWSLYTGHDPII